MKEYKSEEEFLKDYNPEEFDRLSLTTDIIIFSVSSEEVENYRKTDKKNHQDFLLVECFHPLQRALFCFLPCRK